MFDQVGWGEMGGVVLVTATQVLALGLLVWGIGKALRINSKTLAAIALAVMFYNAGNYGLPLAALAFPGEGEKSSGVAGRGSGGVEKGSSTTAPTLRPDHAATPPPHSKDGAAVQTFVAFTLNLMTFTVGLAIAAWAGSGKVTDGLTKLIRMPVLPTLAAALLARWWMRSGDPGEVRHLPVAIERTAHYLAAGLVPVALVTLGAQLASSVRRPRWRPVVMVLLLSALSGGDGAHPLNLWPWPAASLILTAGVPTAVVTLLLTLEVGGDADLAADCVFWTTVFSCVTITGWLVVIQVTG